MTLEEKKIFLNITSEIAKRSKCSFFKVGCILVKDGRIISSGYNGTPRKNINCKDKIFNSREEHSIWSEHYEIHAEMNAIIFAAKYGTSIDGCYAFCTLQPCWNCTKNLIQAGIKGIFYLNEYDRMKQYKEELENFLKINNIEYEKIELEE